MKSREYRPYARTWLVGLIIALLSVIPILRFGHEAPWLIAIPICIGGVIAVAWEFSADAAARRRLAFRR